MNTFIALFRGINVLGKNLLPMKALAGIFEELGYREVRTYIQSGNVVFRSRPVQKDAAARNWNTVRELLRLAGLQST